MFDVTGKIFTRKSTRTQKQVEHMHLDLWVYKILSLVYDSFILFVIYKYYFCDNCWIERIIAYNSDNFSYKK